MQGVLIEAQFLPSIAYFAALSRTSQVVIEKHEHYTKQTYRNRCHILSSQGVESLSIPLTNKHGKVRITDVRIDYTQKWMNHHWRAIQSAYGRAPFYEHYAEDLHRALYRRIDFLYDLNIELLSMCLRWINLSLRIEESLSYMKVPDSRLNDMRSVINLKKTDSLSTFYQPMPYTQVFGSTFAENLSIIDLIFCEGPAAFLIIKASAVEK